MGPATRFDGRGKLTPAAANLMQPWEDNRAGIIYLGARTACLGAGRRIAVSRRGIAGGNLGRQEFGTALLVSQLDGDPRSELARDIIEWTRCAGIEAGRKLGERIGRRGRTCGERIRNLSHLSFSKFEGSGKEKPPLRLSPAEAK